jgi:hypothetical protein
MLYNINCREIGCVHFTDLLKEQINSGQTINFFNEISRA